MRIFVTGATGALGRHLVPGLVAAGREVTAATRTPGKVAQLREAGAEPVVLDGLDREAVIAAVLAAAPEVIVHQMTALAGMRSLRKPDKAFAATNELRTWGTDNLLAAAERAGTRRVIAQGYAGAGPDKPSGGALKTEEDPLEWRPIRSAVQGLAAIRQVDKTVPLEAPEGIVLRYGTFYGPGASDFLLEMLRKRQLPVVGGGTGVWSFIEVTDAAAATIAAVDHSAPGIYNVVDDDPAPVADWLPYLAKFAGAKPPLRVPARLGRLLAGGFVVAQMTTSRGYSNEKARKKLGWVPAAAALHRYGMTGSVADAEDVVQDAFLGLTRARQAGTTITDPKAYLTTVVSRLGINYLRSARVRRETCVGDWLPEPVVVPAGGAPKIPPACPPSGDGRPRRRFVASLPEPAPPRPAPLVTRPGHGGLPRRSP